MVTGGGKKAGRFPQKPLGIEVWYSDCAIVIAEKIGGL